MAVNRIDESQAAAVTQKIFEDKATIKVPRKKIPTSANKQFGIHLQQVAIKGTIKQEAVNALAAVSAAGGSKNARKMLATDLLNIEDPQLRKTIMFGLLRVLTGEEK